MIPGRFCGRSSHSFPLIIATLRDMQKIRKPLAILGVGCLLGLSVGSTLASSLEWNPVRSHSVQIGPQASRLIVGFKATSDNAVTRTIKFRSRGQGVKISQAQTSEADVSILAQRAGVAVASSRQLTPSMHVVFLPKVIYGADVEATLERLRADPSVAFADVDERRYAHALPNDPLFAVQNAAPSPTGASGEWYMQTPSTTVTVDGVATQDLSATDAVSAWGITTGSSGTVIADVDSGIRFDHPDLLRAGFGGRLLPGYDFIGQDLNITNSAALGTFLGANDGDGWDPDPSDPGDWISTTDQQNTVLFPVASCPAENSSWHGTRVMGVLGATTNNGLGIAGMTWNPYILPVRALGKCGGYDSDIIAGMQWAAGLSVNGVPDNPYPADIINLSLGGSGSCPSVYKNILNTLNIMGVLVVASAGNESGPVDAPGDCPGVLAVAGLRNVGTKVGYSSLGPEVGIAAPAGNCVNTSGACLRSIDTTFNTGLTTPGTNTYTDQTNVNLGTSFSAPIVSGIAALMRAVNANLTPAQLIARIESSATHFPPPGATPVCSASVSSNVECACTTGTCGAGMVNAFSAVKAALNPIAAVAVPPGLATGSNTFDGSGSVAACNASITSYAWTGSGGIAVASGATAPQPMVTWNGNPGTLVLTVTDSAGNKDVATVNFAGGSATSTAPSSAKTSASPCMAPMTVTPEAPTITEAFSPASVATSVASTLTLTLSNSNGFALTQSGVTQTLPANLSISTMPAPATTCTGSSMTLTSTSSSVSLAGANIPANGSCTITVSVMSTMVGTYTSMLGANALSTGPAGSNTDSASTSLAVTASSSGGSGAAGGGGGGGGAPDWWDIMFVAGVLLAGRRAGRRQAGAQPRR
jgi:serine protease